MVAWRQIIAALLLRVGVVLEQQRDQLRVSAARSDVQRCHAKSAARVDLHARRTQQHACNFHVCCSCVADGEVERRPLHLVGRRRIGAEREQCAYSFDIRVDGRNDKRRRLELMRMLEL